MKGVAIWPDGQLRKKKDTGEPFVIVRQEIAIQPGVITYERFINPMEEPGVVTINGDKLTGFPSFEQMQPIFLRVDGFRCTSEGKLSFKRAEMVAGKGPSPSEPK